MVSLLPRARVSAPAFPTAPNPQSCELAHPSRAAGVCAQALPAYSGGDGDETWHLAPYQRSADEQPPSPPESSDDDESADDEDDERATARPRLLLEYDGPEKEKKRSKAKNEILVSPRTIAELGKLTPPEIITQGSTFPSAEHCMLAIKELAVRVKAPRPKVNIRRGNHDEYVSLNCTCTAATCAFAVLAGTTRRRAGCRRDDQPAQWVVRTYVGHTCPREVPAATAGDNDAQPKHVSAARIACLPSPRRACFSPLLTRSYFSRAPAFGTSPSLLHACALYAGVCVRMLLACCAARPRPESICLHRLGAPRFGRFEYQPKCVAACALQQPATHRRLIHLHVLAAA